MFIVAAGAVSGACLGRGELKNEQEKKESTVNQGKVPSI